MPTQVSHAALSARAFGFGLVTGPSAYIANAVKYNGTSQYLSRGADFTGNVDSATGLISFWFRVDVTAAILGSTEFLSGFQHYFHVQYSTDNLIYVVANPAAGGQTLAIKTAIAFPADPGWHHFLATWNTNFAAGLKTFQIFVDDWNVGQLHSDTGAAFTTKYTATSWAMAQRYDAGAGYFNGALSEFWFAPNQTLDLLVTANRRKFIGADGKPVNLGPTGNLPTGTTPLIYLPGPAATAGTNANAAAGNLAVINGPLAVSTTSPSDPAPVVAGVPLPAIWDNTVTPSQLSYSITNKQVSLPPLNPTSGYWNVRETTVTPGKRYYEVRAPSPDTFQNFGIGFDQNDSLPPTTTSGWIGWNATSWGLWPSPSASTYYNNGSVSSPGAAGVPAGTIMGFAVDDVSGKMWFSIAGTWQNGGDPATGASPRFTGTPGATFRITGSINNQTPKVSALQFETNLTYPVPAGFVPGGTPAAVPAALWDPTVNPTAFTYSSGNKVVTTLAGTGYALAQLPTRSGQGKRYYEAVHNFASGQPLGIGFFITGFPLTGSYLGSTADSWSLYPQGTGNSSAYHSSTGPSTLPACASGALMGFAIDDTTGKMWFAINGVWVLSGNPATGLNPIFTGTPGATYQFGMTGQRASAAVPFNVTLSTNYVYQPPTGFSAG